MLMVVGSVAIGLIVGFTIGSLGGGGSVLTVPALVYVLGESPRSASGASLIIVGISALIGLTAHARNGRVRWTAGVVFGLIGTGAAVLGTVISKQLDPSVLMLAFAGIILLAAAFMIHQAIKPAAAPAELNQNGAGSFSSVAVPGCPVPVESAVAGVGSGGASAVGSSVKGR